MTGSRSAPPPENGNRAILQCRGIDKCFGTRPVLQNVTLALEAGEVMGLVGPDGAGKTTLLQIAAGLLEADAGTATLLGLDSVGDTLEIKARIGYMPQKFGLYQDLSVAENLELYADLQSIPKARRQQRFEQLLEMTGLERFTGRLAARLSGGMKQKLGLACALIKSPELLLLDEPTAGVDPVSRRDLWRIVQTLVEEDRIGVLLATASLDEAERCHRVAVMFDGELTAEGRPAELANAVYGRTYEKVCNSEREARRLLAELRKSERVVDATLVRGRVRIVLASDADTVLETTEHGGETQSVAPRLEDGFMDLAATWARKTADPAVTSGDEAPAMAARSSAAEQADVDHGIVSVRNLVKQFGDFVAVSGITFDVHRGEIFGLLGPNGAGKSTTFRMLCGLLPATSGELQVARRDLRKSTARARERLGYMAQQFSMYGQLSVTENLRFFGRAYGLSRQKLRERLAWAFSEFHLKQWAERPAGSLPGGYRQRLAMAVALLHRPDILFLDEPTSGVDPLARREFWRRITAVAEAGVTVIVTTHFMEEAEYCDRMLIMSRGEPLALGTPADIRALVPNEQTPDPSIEDAFIALAGGDVDPTGTAVDPRSQERKGNAA